MKHDHYTVEAIERIIEDHSTVIHQWDLSDVVGLAITRISDFRMDSMKELSMAQQVVIDSLVDDATSGLARGARTRIRDAKHLMKEAREDLDRMTYWDTILRTARAMMDDGVTYVDQTPSTDLAAQ